MLLECTHCKYNDCLLYFRVFVLFLLDLVNVYCYGMCIYKAVFGLVCCIPLYCCDTDPASSTSFSINLTWKAACLCPFVGVLRRVLKVECCMIDTGRAQSTPLLQCKDSPLGPVHEQNTHEQLLSPTERRGLLLQPLTVVYWVELIVIRKYWWQFGPKWSNGCDNSLYNFSKIPIKFM